MHPLLGNNYPVLGGVEILVDNSANIELVALIIIAELAALAYFTGGPGV
jgi:hypothetical protein